MNDSGFLATRLNLLPVLPRKFDQRGKYMYLFTIISMTLFKNKSFVNENIKCGYAFSDQVRHKLGFTTTGMATCLKFRL